MTEWASSAERQTSLLVRWTSPAARLGTGALLVAAVGTMPPTTTGIAAAVGVAVAALALSRPEPRWFVTLAAGASLAILGVLLPIFAMGQLERGTRLAIRAFVVVAVALAFAWTQRPHELGGALRGLGVPGSFAAIIATMVRQTASLAPEGRRLLLARELRGARGLALGPDVLARLFVRSHGRAERRALAAELRGARAGYPSPLPLQASDALPLAIAAGAALLVQVLARVAP